MAGLPWAKGNLLIAFAPNDIIKELGPCVGPFSPCISIGLTHTHTQREQNGEKTANETVRTGKLRFRV